MAGVKALIVLALGACLGILFLVLGSALPIFNNWYPMFVLFFYLLAPLPWLVVRRFADNTSSSSTMLEFGIFVTVGVVVSAFALPIVLAHAGPISWGACGFVLVGNVFMFVTMASYFYLYKDEDIVGFL